MANRNLGIGIGIGVAGILGYAISRLVVNSKKEQKAAVPEEKKAAAVPDARPKDIKCPACGASVREYEFFCPACKHPMEQKAPVSAEGTVPDAPKDASEEKK
jgi:hypothetical protein